MPEETQRWFIKPLNLLECVTTLTPQRCQFWLVFVTPGVCLGAHLDMVLAVLNLWGVTPHKGVTDILHLRSLHFNS